MRRSPFDFNNDGKMDSFESAAEFAFLNNLFQDEASDEDDLFDGEGVDDGWSD